MGNPTHPTIQFVIGDTKINTSLRYDAGFKIASLAPVSALYGAHTDLKAAADDLAAKNTALKAATDSVSAAEAAVPKARTAVLAATADWDTSYDVFLTTGAKYCISPEDAASLALTMRGTTHNPLAMPIAVTLLYNIKKDLLRIHVKRAPGMDVVVVQVSPDPITATSWKEQDGCGAVHVITNPAPGTWWVRAASKTARAMSDFTTPVSIVIK